MGDGDVADRVWHLALVVNHPVHERDLHFRNRPTELVLGALAERRIHRPGIISIISHPPACTNDANRFHCLSKGRETGDGKSCQNRNEPVFSGVLKHGFFEFTETVRRSIPPKA